MAQANQSWFGLEIESSTYTNIFTVRLSPYLRRRCRHTKITGMFYITRPSSSEIDEQLAAIASDTFSYSAVGATRELSPPEGYIVDHNRELLGRGRDTFEKARQAIREWKMFEIPGLRLFYPDTPIEPRRNVALRADHLGFHSLNFCRIAYVIDEPDRFGFAYGTLSQHAESGEERFSIEHHPDTGEVWYDIYAFSRPGNVLIKVGYPYARYRQKQFAVESKAAMKRAVKLTGSY
jgi:uncharacterized protein (UPF0548 family)